MYIKNVTFPLLVKNPKKPESLIITKANEFNAHIWLQKQERRVNAKSLLGVLSLRMQAGENISVLADGEDEQQAVEAIVAMMEQCFADVQ